MFEDNDLNGLLKTISTGKFILNIGSEEICPPCRRISPLFHELKEKTENITFIKVDVQTNGDIAQHFNVSSIPHFISIHNGEKVSEFKGANEAKLKEVVEELNNLN
jgi:thioredoxin-like negative regulator of GroEL